MKSGDNCDIFGIDLSDFRPLTWEIYWSRKLFGVNFDEGGFSNKL